VVPAHESVDANLAWPERWPVLGPVAGFAVATSFTIVAVAEADWVATTVFAAVAALLGAVALRNERVTRGDGPPRRPMPRPTDSGGRSSPGR
jgi:hypothetical protein